VEEAFYCTDRVMTCSFHKYGDFFPGEGGWWFEALFVVMGVVVVALDTHTYYDGVIIFSPSSSLYLIPYNPNPDDDRDGGIERHGF